MSVTKTPNLNLNLPSFNDSPWHDDVNDNFASIDATIKSIFGIDGLLGSYKNSTAVTLGQRYFDTVTGYYYEAQSSFTTEADPSTFAEERTAYPDRWELLDAAAAISAASNAAASATAAASSASSATTSETNAAASATTATTKASEASTSATNAATSATSAAASAASAASIDATSFLAKADNLSGLTNAATARTNIGLNNVDNVADTDKPVSTAQQTAIDLKLAKANNLSDIADAATARTNLSLGNVDNTSDVNKPVSTATQAVIDGLILGGPSLGVNSIIRYNALSVKADMTLWEDDATCTADAGADTINKGSDDNFADGDIVQLSSTGSLPAGLSLATNYYVRDIAAGTMKLASSGTGAAIDITDAGTGTHTIYKPINGITAGPIEIADGVTVNVKSGSTWSVV